MPRDVEPSRASLIGSEPTGCHQGCVETRFGADNVLALNDTPGCHRRIAQWSVFDGEIVVGGKGDKSSRYLQQTSDDFATDSKL